MDQPAINTISDLTPWIDPEEIDGILAALETAGGVLLFGIVIFVVLYAFGELDQRRQERNSPVNRLLRNNRHFGGV